MDLEAAARLPSNIIAYALSSYLTERPDLKESTQKTIDRLVQLSTKERSALNRRLMEDHRDESIKLALVPADYK